MKLKIAILTLAIALLSLPAFAQDTLTITIGTESRTYSAKTVEVLETDMISIADWLFNAIEEKHRRVLDRVVAKETPYNPQKMSTIDKHLIIENVVLESAKDRKARFESEMEK